MGMWVHVITKRTTNACLIIYNRTTNQWSELFTYRVIQQMFTWSVNHSATHHPTKMVSVLLSQCLIQKVEIFSFLGISYENIKKTTMVHMWLTGLKSMFTGWGYGEHVTNWQLHAHATTPTESDTNEKKETINDFDANERMKVRMDGPAIAPCIIQQMFSCFKQS